MPYGIIKVDQVTFTNAGVDQTISVSGIVASISGNITATGTISGDVIRGGTLVSGATVTGTAGQFGTITGNTAGFTTVTGTTITGTTLTVASGTFTGNSTAAAFIPTGSTVPTNGVYLPAANSVAISTNGSGRLFINSSGQVGIGVSPSATLEVNGESRFTRSGVASQYVGIAADGTDTRIVAEGSSKNLTIKNNSSTSSAILFDQAVASSYIFNQAGNERMRLDSSGRLGVGTSSPNQLLEVENSSGSAAINITSSDAGYAELYFGDQSNASAAALSYEHSSNKLRIYNGGSVRATIDSSGNVGVGTTSPGSILHTAENASTYIRVQRTTSGTEGNLYLGCTSSANQIISEGSSSVAKALRFDVGSTEAMRITSAGLVGIGTSSPGELLDVAGSIRQTGNTAGTANTVGLIDFYNANNTTTIARVNVRTDGAANSGSYRISTANAGTLNEVVRITSGGLVGIGSTSDPGAVGSRLWIDTTGDTYFTANSTGSGNLAGIHFRNSNGNGEARILNNTGGALTFYRSPGNEAVRIDSSGRLLVGTSTSVGSNAKIQAITGDLYCYEAYQTGGNAYPAQFNFTKTRGTAGTFTVVAAEDYLGTLSFRGTDGSAIKTAAEIHAVVDGTPGANDMPGRLVFSTTANGAGTPTTRVTIESTGALKLENGASNLYRPGASGSGIGFSTNCTIPLNETGAASDNTENLGAAGTRWATVYAGTGTINTSDANLKQDVTTLEQVELQVASKIKGLIKKYRYIDAVADKGGDARIHVGVIAQEVEQAFVAEGLDPRRYALFCEDTLEDGSKRLGIRYDELLAFVIAAL